MPCLPCFFFPFIMMFGVVVAALVLLFLVWVRHFRADSMRSTPLLLTTGLLALASLFSIYVLSIFYLSPRQGNRLAPPGEHGLYWFGLIYFLCLALIFIRIGNFSGGIKKALIASLPVASLVTLFLGWNFFASTIEVGDYWLPATVHLLLPILGYAPIPVVDSRIENRVFISLLSVFAAWGLILFYSVQ